MTIAARAALVLSLAASGVAAASTESPVWSGYLDYAYIYSSADAAALRERLDGYADEAGIPLERYVAEYFETLAPLEGDDGEVATRRKAVAYLLDYLARGDVASLEQSVRAVRDLGTHLERHENRYWYHYILAHKALERGHARDFVEEVLNLWVRVVVPLETTYETLETLALSESPNAGFSSALPYLYENVARLVLIKSQERGIDRDLDPLGAVVRLLHDGRVGAQPEVIPAAASSKAYLDRIVLRLDGAESDGGSLTFTLALFEATKHHEHARGLLARNGLDSETLRAMARASGAYETALNRAQTAQGQCAVYTRVLRQLGELYAAQQRLGVDAEVDLPFSVEGAIRVYARLRRGLGGDHAALGYRGVPRALYLESMQRLWAEIQEASLNVGDYYLARSTAAPHQADLHARSAARAFGRYLGFFHQYATEDGREAVPDSAYFAAFEAAKGTGDAFLRYADDPGGAEISLGIDRWRSALLLFPFDREIWPALTSALGRRGRESEYPTLVQPIAERVARSRAVATWIDAGEPYAERVAIVRRALSDPLVVMYMGFAEGTDVADLERELAELAVRRREVAAELLGLVRRRDALRGGALPASAAEEPDPVTGAGASPELASVARAVAETGALLTKLEAQIAARTRALPLYKDTLQTDGLVAELRAQRDHPFHTLLARMYYEGREARGESSRGEAH
jgi:hypothetical protein